ncbi:MAG: hypothetical protein MJ193_01745, partial [Clostridia bacterium]|nr:hypothetical protein [Clostridia bacterium]
MTSVTTKKYLPFAILFVAMLLVFLSVALAFDGRVDTAVAADEQLYVKVSCANVDSNGWAVASSGNKITLKIGIYNAAGTAVAARKSVGVNYKTEDNTAVAAAYDYTADNGTMYFNVGEKEKSLGVQISTTPFATYTTGTTKYNTRTFFFRLVSLSTEDANISIPSHDKGGSITCRLNYTYAYETKTVDSKVIFSEYYNSQSKYVSLNSDNHDDDYAWFNAYDENSTVKNWWKYFKETGLASVAGTGIFVLDENGALQNDTRYYFYVGDKWVMKIEEDGYIYDDTDLDLTRIWDHSYSGSDGHSNIEWSESTVPSASDPRVIYRTSDKDWWYLPADSNEKPKCAINQCPDGGSTDRHCKGNLYMVPIDTSALKIKNWYIDTEDKKITSDNLDPNRNILRAYMRFNEPVQIVGTAPKLEYSVNMASSSRPYT